MKMIRIFGLELIIEKDSLNQSWKSRNHMDMGLWLNISTHAIFNIWKIKKSHAQNEIPKYTTSRNIYKKTLND